MSRRKICFSLALVFLSGIIFGAALTRAYVKHRIERVLNGGPPAVRELIIERLSARLDLSAEQEQRVAKIVGDAHAQILELRLADQPRINAIIAEAVDRMRPELKPEQAEELKQIVNRLHSRFAVEGALQTPDHPASAASRP